MAMRVTQGLMYSSFITGMNKSLSAYMESNIQSSSQKRVNRPSDDPVSAGRILSTRAGLEKLASYDENIKQAMGWLNLADNIVGSGDGSVQTVLSRIKTLAQEAADGTKTRENRLQISYEVRQHFEQIINLANMQFEGRHIFAGHKTDEPAYRQGLAVTCYDTTGAGGIGENVSFDVTGNTSSTVVLQVVGSTTPGWVDGDPITAGTALYRVSTDGGKTWSDPSDPLDTSVIVEDDVPDTGQCRITTSSGAVINVSDKNALVTMVDTDNEHTNDNGTWLYVRPTAIYQGDDDSHEVTSAYRPAGSNPGLNAEADGHFARDIIVRLDKLEGGKVYYSYSTDDGSNWTAAHANDTSPGNITLPIPGGKMNLENLVGGVASPLQPADMGTQFVVHPHRADIDFAIGDGDSITVNMVGKDIFGGLYDKPEDQYGYPVAVEGSGNLFETVGKLIAALETNSQQGVQESLKELEDVMNVVLTRAAEIGGRENRLIVTQSAMVMRSYAEEDNLSAMEDVDVSTLMTRLAQQQLAYNSVLKSSSMIMQMSLLNFL